MVHKREIEAKDYMDKHFYHMFANGDDAKNFIINESDYRAAFNRFAICAANTQVQVYSFSIEESHPHSLLYGTYEECLSFATMYENSSRHYIASKRGNLDNVVLECTILLVDNDDYLRNVAAYTITQPTKDGKHVMPYDFKWGTGSMYFRPEKHIPVWCFDDRGNYQKAETIGSLSTRKRREILCSKKSVPEDWLVCNGLILPDNYVNIKGYEQIFATHNCFRAFMCAGRKNDEIIIERMAASRGVSLEDLEARRIAKHICQNLFGKSTARWLDTQQRIKLAIQLRRRFKISIRQISTLSRLPEAEVIKYIR